MLPEFTPLGTETLVVAGVSGLTAEQVDLVTAPFVPDEKVKAVATLQSFSVTLDLSGVTLPSAYRCRVWVYVLGSASVYAPLSYNPTPPRLPKSRLWRLLGGEAENAVTVQVNLSQAAQVARLAPEVRGVFNAQSV